MERLKRLDEVTKIDRRQERFVSLDLRAGKVRKRTLGDHHGRIAAIRLNASVPRIVREHFETAKNLLLYSWFVYRFIPVAEFHAMCSLEFALRERSGGKTRGLKPLIRLAIEKKWVRNEGFSAYRDEVRHRRAHMKSLEELDRARGLEAEMSFKPPNYLKILEETMPALRNELAHGSGMLYWGGYRKLRLCADFINQLY